MNPLLMVSTRSPLHTRGLTNSGRQEQSPHSQMSDVSESKLVDVTPNAEKRGSVLRAYAMAGGSPPILLHKES